MKLIPRRKRPDAAAQEERGTNDPIVSLESYFNWLQSFQYQGLSYSLPGSPQENVSTAFASLAQQAYKSNGIVFACMLSRQLLFSEARFKWRQVRASGPGNLFGTPELLVLEKPWPNATSTDLLSRAIQDADLGGNAFFVRRGNRLARLRPDWVKIVVGSPNDSEAGVWDVEAEILGYTYKPGGPGSRSDEEVFLREEVAHFKPIPDPEAQFRGMSWLTPIVREIMADKAATQHKLSFFENGATPNLVVKLDTPDVEAYKTYVELFKQGHEGSANAYKTIFLAAGADATVVGANLRQLDFKVVQGAGETRIAAAAGVPPIIVGLSEGLEAATYSNYGQARRAFADGTMRHLWRSVCGAFSGIVNVPTDSELWYDDRDIMFLQEDRRDAAEIQSLRAQTIRTLVDGGFTPVSAIDAVNAEDFSRLVHTGLYSVQLQLPGTVSPPPAVTNGQAGRDKQERILIELLEALP